MGSPQPLLLPHHQELIRASAISERVADARGYRSMTTRAAAARLGFGKTQQNVPALLIPVHSVTGEVVTYQLRPDSPRVRDGKPVKYETPSGSRMALDVPLGARERLGDPSVPLFITEGARKADAAVSAGLCCIGLLGVWNWRGTNDQGGVMALPDWESIALKGRTVYLAFDSDVMTKPAVHMALNRLSSFLAGRGADPWPIYLPASDGGAKVGLDDYLASGHTVDDLLACATDTLRPAPADDRDGPSAGPYAIRDGRIGTVKRTNDGEIWTPLANFTARITEEVIADDGVSERGELVIHGALPDGAALPAARVPLSRFEAMSWVTAKWGARAVVTAGQGSRDKLREAIQLLSSDLARRREFTHAGWRDIDGTWRYLTGTTVIGPDGPVSGVCVQLDGTAGSIALPEPPEGTELQAAIEIVLTILDLAPDRVTVPLLGAALRAPLNEVASADLTLFLAGPSGVFKSELAAVIQRFFGTSFDRLNVPATWAATANYLERIAFDFKDAVLLIDDFAPAGTPLDVRRYHLTADRVIRGAGNAAGRGRMQADGTTRPALPPRALILSTGEDVPTGHSIRARMLVLDVERGDVDKERLSHFQVEPDRSAPSRATAGYVRWLASRLETIRAELPMRQASLRAAFSGAGVHPRTPDLLASLALGWWLWLRFAVDEGGITTHDAEHLWQRVHASLIVARRQQADHQTGEEPARRFFDLLSAAIASGGAYVAGSDGNEPDTPVAWGWRERTIGTGDYVRTEWQARGDCVGWLEGGELYLEATAAYVAAQRIGQTAGTTLAVQPRTLWKRLDEAGFLLTTERNRNTRTVRKVLAGRRRDTIHVSPQSLSPAEPAHCDQSTHHPWNEPHSGSGTDVGGQFSRADPLMTDVTSAPETDPERSMTIAKGHDGQIGQLPFDGEPRVQAACCICGTPLPSDRRYLCVACSTTRSGEAA
jgi:hypothetical protein